MATRYVYQSSKDGQFISKREAGRRPATTEREKISTTRPAQSRKKK